MAYRGTADREFFKDWKVNGEIAGGSTHTTRVQEAQVQFDNVASKYGKNNLTVSGHSQGGHVSYEMAVRNDVEGFHYNPAINSTQVRNAGQYAGNMSQQMVYKQPLHHHCRLVAARLPQKIFSLFSLPKRRDPPFLLKETKGPLGSPRGSKSESFAGSGGP